MQIMLTMIVTWLSVNFALPAVYDHPDISFVAPEAMQSVRYQAAESEQSAPRREPTPPSSTPEVESFYDDTSWTVHLSQDWTGGSPAELSLLVHEMVHHLQSAAKLTYACPGAREKPAYAAQKQWLAQFGRNLTDEFGLDPMTILVRTNCMF